MSLKAFLIGILALGTSVHAESTDLTQEMVPTEVLILEAAAKPTKKGGGSSSIGADSHDLKIQTSWFYGSRPIKTCYNSIASFGVKDKDLEVMIKRSFTTWKEYFELKQIRGKSNAKTSDETVNLNFKFTGKCKGNEDLVFYFGTGPIFGNTQDLKSSQTLQAPLAFANKTQIRRDMKWSKGYLRFISQGYYSNAAEGVTYPDWRNPKALEAVLIHEIGHILGFAHTPHTIMSGELMESIYDTKKEPSLSIDQDRQLVTCAECKVAYVLDKADFNSAVFAKIGLDSKKEIRLVPDGKTFVVSDTRTKLMVEDLKTSRSETTQTLFSNFDLSGNHSTESLNIYGQIKYKDGVLPVIMEYNSADHKGGIAVRIVSENKIEMLGAFKK